ncbi:GntR family transcriptional regulator [Caballeronia calidae]|uniref:GntR family transcriptional regulator n=1 Tax=Caballeronia calidae TaxID=1777139 RepID=A0A158EC19_9BURK|nr:GntR family transcriptional regulator [Caballeronia calidae]SAL04323.1 GntR family transcriptional regulator [Caballeronia calidae]
MGGLRRLKPHTDLVDEVYGALADAISDGTLMPGTRVTQEELAEQLSVSRSPVLQAIRLLKKDGLVRDAPGRGVLVAPLDPVWLGNLYQIRGTLDSLASSLAAQRRIQLDKQLLSNGRKASNEGDVRAMIDADIAFHLAIYDASCNPLIADTARVHWVHLRRVMGALLQSSGQRTQVWDEHEAIAEAIGHGAVARAVSLSEQHTSRAHAHLSSKINEMFFRTSESAAML